MNQFEERVEKAFERLIQRGDMSVVSSTRAGVFDNADVTLAHGDLLIRVMRERGAVSAQFASALELDNWFDATIVGELFEDLPEPAYMDISGAILLERFASFVEKNLTDLATAFNGDHFNATRTRLERLEQESVKRRFGV